MEYGVLDYNNTEFATLQNAKRFASAAFMRNRVPSVVGVGIGRKIVRGRETRALCVRIYVDQKANPLDIGARELIPREILGAPTDIIEVGQAFQPLARPGSPVRLGAGRSTSARTGTPNINPRTSGTFGAVLIDEHKKPYMLGTNHAIAVNGRAIRHKMVVLENDPANPGGVGTPSVFVRLQPPDFLNEVDCALANLEREPDPGMALPVHGDGLPRLGRSVFRMVPLPERGERAPQQAAGRAAAARRSDRGCQCGYFRGLHFWHVSVRRSGPDRER